MLLLCDHNEKDPDGQYRTVKHRKTFGKGREGNAPFSSSHTALLSATKDNRENTRRQDEVLQLIAA